MSETSNQHLGELIQAYVHAKWAGESDEKNIVRLGARLPPEVRERVDALGFEGEHLLSVDSAEVLAKIEALEHEAAEEDARAHKSASLVRAEEQKAIDRGAHAVGHTARPPSGGHRKRVGRRGGRPRNRS
jgi:hypothetical protein